MRFCREVDDIADDEGSPDDKRRRLDKWREEIGALYAGNPETLTARALAEPVRRFGMRREDFLAVIDGMQMDLGDGLKAPDLDELELYCHRVAGAVGLLSIRAFGARGAHAEAFASRARNSAPAHQYPAGSAGRRGTRQALPAEGIARPGGYRGLGAA